MIHIFPINICVYRGIDVPIDSNCFQGAISMSIYESTKVKPYVYWLTHKTTGQFYIGYREANVLPSDQDLLVYKTSSNKVSNLGFENFDWKIIAEFHDGSSAYHFEQQLIEENLHNSLCLNGHFTNSNGPQFRRVGPHTNETRLKQSLAKKGKLFSIEHKAKLSAAKQGYKRSPEAARKAGLALKDKPLSSEHKIKISLGLKNHKFSDETRAKISATLTGKKQSKETIEKRNLSRQRTLQNRILQLSNPQFNNMT
jgi:hypothetical protein